MSKRGRAGFLGRSLREGGPRDPRNGLTAVAATTLTWDLATDALTWGPNAAEVLGIAHIGRFPTGAALADAVEPGCGPGRRDALQGAEPAHGGPDASYHARYALRIKADRLVVIEETGRCFLDGEGRAAFAHAVLLVDASASRQDVLDAGLKARAALLSQIVDDVVEAQRSRHVITLVVGACETEGDSDGAMAEIARRIRPLMRRRDRFFVYGANRFALALASCASPEAEAALARILALVEGRGSGSASLGSVWLGAACAPDHAVDAPELLRRAEEALAAARDRGIPGHAVYGPTQSRRARPALGTRGIDIVHALNDRRIAAAWLPVVEARTRNVLFHDTLPRLMGPGGSPSPASDLAAAAEREGFCLLLAGRMLEKAADRLAAQSDERVALRASQSALADGEWLGMLAAHLGSRRDIESRLIVDIPETAVSDPALRGRLDAMKALGVATMLSGFGAGHAGYRHLRHLPVDMIKIDGALIRALPSSFGIRRHVRGLIDLAHDLGIVAVADGVADAATARLLADWGADCLQGAVAGAPLPAAVPKDDRRRGTG